MVKPRIRSGIAATLLISGGLPLAGSILVRLSLPNWHWTHEPLHSVVEGAGAFIALTVAALLPLQLRLQQTGVHFIWMASALIGMGLLDGFHSGFHGGPSFVWTHSLAKLVGGFLSSLAWLPDHLARTRLAKALPALVAVSAIAIGILTVTLSDQLPVMINGNTFTAAANAMNFLGGLFFMAAGAGLVLRYQAQGTKGDLLFANQCLLFGAAGVLFVYSTLWGARWWYWHLLRLLAYCVVLGYAFFIYLRLQQESKENEARSRALLNAIPDLILRFQLDGTLLDFQAHDAFSDLRTPPQMMIGTSIYQSPMRREVVDQIMAASRRAAETGDVQSVEFAYPRESELRHYEARIVASGASELVATVRNITERRKNEEHVQLLLNATAEGIFGMDMNGICSFVNPASLRLLGFDNPSQVVGQNIHLLCHHTRPDGTPYPVEECRAGQAVRRGEGIHVDDEVAWRSDGTSFPMEYWAYPVRRGEEVVGAVVTFVDITERKGLTDALRRSQEDLRALTAELIKAREEESRYLARELHDSFGQRLALLGLKASELEGLISSQPGRAAENVRLMMDEIGGVAKDLHHLSRQLHPAVLRELGLQTALETECANHSRQDGITVEFRSEDVSELLSEEMALCLYRVAQESLQNIRKHARTEKASVTLAAREGNIVLTVQDFGIGFDFKGVKGRGGLGLVSMGERVRLVDGSIGVRSKPGQGTEIEVRIPIRRG